MLGKLLLRRFKAATAELHVEAERYVRILDDDATLVEYRRYLRAMHGFIAPVEAALAAAGMSPARCEKAALLRADLVTLGEPVGPACCAIPRIAVRSRAVGCAYVLEGSTLGGRFILAKLPPAIAAVRGTATRYLEGYGADTGAMWRAFGELAGTVTDEDDAVAAACETFAALVDWLAQHEVRGRVPFAEAS
jgi:heme oxygenase